MQLSEREKRTLNELLQVNLLSKNTINEKLSKKKPKSLKFLNTDNLSTTNKKGINYRNRPQFNLLQFSRFYKDLNNQDRFLIIYR